MGIVTSAIGAYKSILGGRLGITKDDELVVGGRIFNTQYAALGSGVAYYVDPDNGDNNLAGRTPGTAVASLVTAFGLTTAEQNDAVIIIGDGNTSGTCRLTANLDWNKDATHLIGIGAANRQAKRTRISHAATAPTAGFTLFTVSADGCALSNFGMFSGPNHAATRLDFVVSGNRNSFNTVAFEGMGHQSPADQAGSVVLSLVGARENLFDYCTVGVETIQRDTANNNLVFTSGCRRNEFRDTLFTMWATDTAQVFVTASAAAAFAGSSERFDRCQFLALGPTNPTGATPAVVFVTGAGNNGTIYVTDCVMNAAKWHAASDRVQIAGSSAVNDTLGFTGGKFEASTDS